MTVDIHAHVVPGLDDGPRTFAEADAIQRNFREAGVDDVICTPHYLHPLFDLKVVHEPVMHGIKLSMEGCTGAR